MPLMVGNVLRNFCSRPVTRPYPFVLRAPFRGTRGSIEFQAENCLFCGDCERVCPSGAILLDTRWEPVDATEPTWYRIFDPCSCIFCGACIDACPYQALMFGGRHESPATRRHPQFDRVDNW